MVSGLNSTPQRRLVRRSQMGHAAGLMLSDGPSPVIEAGQGYWLAQSGVASVDMNMALVSSRVPEQVDKVLARATQSQIPTLFMVADSDPAEELVAPWQFVGELPFMATSLDSQHLRADARVRQAEPHDAAIVYEVMGEAFGIEADPPVLPRNQCGSLRGKRRVEGLALIR